MADPLDLIDWADPVADHPENANLVGWWMAGTDPPYWGGDQLRDLCAKSHGTLSGFTAGGWHWRGGPNGLGSLALDGTNDCVALGTSSGVGTIAGALTAVLAVRTTDTGAFRHLVGAYLASGAFTGWGVSLNSGAINFWSNAAGVWRAAGASIANGLWRHVVVTGSGSSGVAYVDGVQWGTFTFSAPGSHTGAVYLCGRSDASNTITASVGAFRIFRGAKTAAAALAEYHQWREGFPDLLRRTPRRVTFVPASGGGGSSANLTGATSLAATLTRSVSRALSASETPSAALAKSTARALAASETPSGSALAKSTAKPLAASETPSAALTKSTGRTLDAASESPSGALTKSTSRAIVADATPSAALAKSTARTLPAASLSPSGSILTGFGRAFEASLSLSATFTRSVLKALNGGVAPDAAMLKSTARALEAASLAPSGGTASKSHGKLLTGALSLAGALTRSLARALSAALSLAASLATEGGVTEAPGIRIRDAIRLDPVRDFVAFDALADRVRLDSIRDRIRW